MKSIFFWLFRMCISFQLNIYLIFVILHSACHSVFRHYGTPLKGGSAGEYIFGGDATPAPILFLLNFSCKRTQEIGRLHQHGLLRACLERVAGVAQARTGRVVAVSAPRALG